MRDYVRCHLELDEFSATHPDHAYPVYSIYLDSADLRLCQATLNGDRNRYKLRLRYYSSGPDEPVFCEIKRRANDCIRKQRAAVRRAAVAGLLAGDWPRLDHLVTPEGRGLGALEDFCQLAADLQAVPRAHVRYQREAWVSPAGNSLRVTFDRAVACLPQDRAEFITAPVEAQPVFGNQVILEVKFTDRFPRWIGEMVEEFGLVRGNAAKYADGITGCQGAARGQHWRGSVKTLADEWART